MREPESADVHGVGPSNEAGVVRFAGLAFDPAACTLARESGEAIPLTRGELALLREFVSRPGRVLSRNALLDALTKRPFEPFDRSVDVMVGKLRRKIEPDPKQPRLIVTVPGEGYRFDGLAKYPFSGQGTRTAVPPSSKNDELRYEDEGSDATPERRAKHDLPKVEAKQASQAGAIDQTKSRTPEPRSLVPMGATIAAFLFLAAASGWFLVAGKGANPTQAGHLSIVVLPFANLSGDSTQDYLADGITDNLTSELSRITNSFVIARNTAFAYKGKTIDAKAIGRELSVRYLLEGSMQREGARVRVNAQLVDAESGAHLWADRFVEEMADLLKLEDEVVTRLAHGLNLALIEAESEKGSKSRNPDAIDLTMRGTDLLIRTLSQPEEEMRKVNPEARALFQRALQIDPDDQEALSGSAATYLREYVFGWGDAGTDYEAKVLGQANRAIALGRNTTGAYQVKADYLNMSGRPQGALNAADAGLAARPNNVSLYAPRGSAENALGRFKEAKADVERAIRLSPLDPFLGQFLVILGDAEINLGHFDAAIDAYRKALNSGQRWYAVYASLSAAYAQAGKIDEAKAALAEARRLNPDLTVKWLNEMAPYPAVLDGLRKAGLPEE